MHLRKIISALFLCLTLALSAGTAFADSGDWGTASGEPAFSAFEDEGGRAISGTTGSFVRVSALKGRLTISANSTISPDTMYAKVMLQKLVSGTWTNVWSSYATVPDESAATSGYMSVSTVNVSSSGTYRCKVYVTEVYDGDTNTVGPCYSQSVSL